MNHLEQLKHKLMVKPTAQERERIAIVIKGDKTKKKPREPTKKKSEKTIGEKLEEGVIDLSEQISEIQKVQGLLPTDIDADNFENLKESNNDKNEDRGLHLIIDKTQQGYDRQALLKKLAESKKTKVTVKPLIEIEEKKIEKVVEPKTKKAKKIEIKKPLIIEDEDEEVKPVEEIKDGDKSPEEFVFKKKVNFKDVEDVKDAENVKPKEDFIEEKKDEESPDEFVFKKKKEDVIEIKLPKEKKRKTEKPEKGVAVLGPEVNILMGDTDITKRLPVRSPPVNIKVDSYVMNNREIFVNFINSLFQPYKRELDENKESISCDTIGKTSTNFSLLTHQKIVRDYLNLYTPYRGLLLYHGLGSGKTCTSIGIAEGMKDSKNVIIMTPASLRANYVGELKKCGDLIYKKNQFWEWISTEEHPEALKTMSAVLNLPQEYIRRHGGAFFINVKKRSNYDELSDTNKRILEEQLNEMIKQKYQFINYNGLREKRLEEMTSGYTKNIFDNAVVIIDEAHNFISRIVNKLKKEKPIAETSVERKKVCL